MCILSPFVQALISDLKAWLKKLESLSIFFEEYRKIETKWNYLEPLFSAEDIVWLNYTYKKY